MCSSTFMWNVANNAAAGGGQDKAIRRTDDSNPPHQQAMLGATKGPIASLQAQDNRWRALLLEKSMFLYMASMPTRSRTTLKRVSAAPAQAPSLYTETVATMDEPC